MTILAGGCLAACSGDSSGVRDPIVRGMEYSGDANRHIQGIEAESRQAAGRNPDGSNTIGPWLTTKAPRVLSSPQPDYPVFALAENVEADVKVRFQVTREGNVSRAVVESSTDHRFDAAALTAVKQWKFAPAIEQGKPSEFEMTVPILFR